MIPHLNKPPFRDAALKYAAMGFHVFPAHHIVQNSTSGALECSCVGWKRKKNKKLYGTDESPTCDAPGKHGRVDSWKKRASNDPAQIERWAKEWSTANVGIATGELSGIFVLDLDGDEGKANLAALEEQNGALPPTVTVITGSGGLHYYFKHAAGLALNNSASTVAPKIDIRANGGFVIAPPSNHKSGGDYVFKEGCGLDEISLAEAPLWLIELASKKLGKTKAPAKNSPALVRDPAPESEQAPAGHGCGIRGKAATDSDGKRPPIPRQSGQ